MAACRSEFDVQTPSAPAGNYYFVLIIDSGDAIPEPTGNNTWAKSVTVTAL